VTRVLLLGAKGAAARGVKNSLELAGGYEVIGVDDPSASDEDTLLLAAGHAVNYVHAQPDEEVLKLSRIRRSLRDAGCATFLPRRDVIDLCQDKWKTYLALSKCGVPVPRTSLSEADFRGEKVHIRPRVGAGGKGSYQGWTAGYVNDDNLNTIAELLPGPTVTWQGIYAKGKLIVSQQRKRLEWTHGDRGSCLVGETYSDAVHNKIALDAIYAVDLHPHGIYGVDMTLDAEGNPRVTEINIGRFFTTIEFFAQAGVNFPDIVCRLALGEDVEPIGSNPLPNGLRWERAIDALPVLCTS